MKPMGWKAIRKTFLTFFAERGHTVVPSSSLVPAGDPTLLFTNSGMVQFKNAFLGLETPPYDRAVTVQKCLRVSGHHNDLETVGASPWHHTFFQMCGNFAFGAYFKREAIRYAWELVTTVYGVPADRLYFTVFETDEDAWQAWRELGVPAERIYRMGEETNFWMMGDVGPVGPTSELHYDWGREYCTCGRDDCSVVLDNGCSRWLEIWNLVFMQFDQGADRSRTPLPRPGVDTGMGLERITAVLQQRPSVFDTDLFAPMTDRIRALLDHSPEARGRALTAYRVIADHARSTAFLIADGVMPGNEGRNYVLRMIIRRAVRFGRRVGLDRPFLGEVTDAVVEAMGDVYPELAQRREFIRRSVVAEEERFGQTLALGLQRLDEAIAALRARGEQEVSGDVVFRLYDTFGFPVEMTRDVAREQGLAIDERGFAEAMARQRERARAASGFAGEADALAARSRSELPVTEFLGYKVTRARGTVLTLLRGGERRETAEEGEEVEVILDRTPFYPEGGGQVGDRGILETRRWAVEVTDTQKAGEGTIVHRGRVVRGTVRGGDEARAAIDAARRRDIMRNHTATHLLHRALHEVLGEHAKQAGSLVAPDRLRFDFTHLSALTEEERQAVEARVNEKILEGLPVRPRWTSYDEALRGGAMALFGEKYGERVRVVAIDDYSRELCGGTHLTNTAQIGLFKIVAEGSAAAGIRRIEAVTGRGAVEYLRAQEGAVREMASLLKVAPLDVLSAVRKLQDRVRQLERDRASIQVSREEIRDLVDKAERIGPITWVVYSRANLSHETLRRLSDEIRSYAPSSVAVLASDSNGRLNTVTSVAPHAADLGIEAVTVFRQLTQVTGGSGGGDTRLAQGGGGDPSQLPRAVEKAKSYVQGLVEPKP